MFVLAYLVLANEAEWRRHQRYVQEKAFRGDWINYISHVDKSRLTCDFTAVYNILLVIACISKYL